MLICGQTKLKNPHKSAASVSSACHFLGTRHEKKPKIIQKKLQGFPAIICTHTNCRLHAYKLSFVRIQIVVCTYTNCRLYAYKFLGRRNQLKIAWKGGLLKEGKEKREKAVGCQFFFVPSPDCREVFVNA